MTYPEGAITIKDEVKTTRLDISFDLTYAYSKDNGKYNLVLDETNSPYPWIQSYNWSVVVPEQE